MYVEPTVATLSQLIDYFTREFDFRPCLKTIDYDGYDRIDGGGLLRGPKGNN